MRVLSTLSIFIGLIVAGSLSYTQTCFDPMGDNSIRRIYGQEFQQENRKSGMD